LSPSSLSSSPASYLLCERFCCSSVVLVVVTESTCKFGITFGIPNTPPAAAAAHDNENDADAGIVVEVDPIDKRSMS
jgi:hypothetical protein